MWLKALRRWAGQRKQTKVQRKRNRSFYCPQVQWLENPVAPATLALFTDGFENGAAQWSTLGSGVVTTAQASTGTHSLTFTNRTWGGDAFSTSFSVTPGQTYQLSVDYLTYGDGGFIGIDQPGGGAEQ